MIDNTAIRDIKRAIPLVDLVAERVKLKRNGKGYVGLCPFHLENSPSLHVYTDNPDDQHFHCFGCGKHGDAFEFIRQTEGGTFPDILKKLAPRAGVKLPNGSEPTKQRTTARTLVFDYIAADGTLVAKHERHEDEHGKKIKGPMLWYTLEGYRKGKAGLEGKPLPDLPLYRLPELLKAPVGEPVLLVEGEKACDAAREAGFVAVSLAGGASQTAFGEALQPLAGRIVYLWPDNDSVGVELMERVGTALQGIAADVKWLQPANTWVQEKDDAFDFFAGAGSAAMLRIMMEQAPRYTDAGTNHNHKSLSDYDYDSASEGGRAGPEVSFTPRAVLLSNVPEPEPRNFFVADLLPEGVVTTLYGDGGLGKSYVALYIGMLVTGGKPFDGRAVMQSRVMYVDAELDQDEICRRAYQVARGMGLSQLPDGFYYYTLGGRSITEPEVQTRLAAEIEHAGVPFIVLDSLTMGSYGGDPKDAPDMIKVVKYLESLGVTTLAIDHIVGTNPNANQSQYREFGSVFKRNAVRSSIQVVRATGGGLSLIHKKANFGPLQEPTNLVMSFEAGNAVTFSFVEPTDERMAGIGDHMPATERVWLELARYSDGSTPDGIAEELDIAVGTVKNYLTALKKARRAEPLGDGRWAALRGQS